MEKKLHKDYQELSQAHPQQKVRLWSMDEHRIGLKPIHRRAWFPWWVVPTAKFKWCFEWLWVYGFVEPNKGETDWWLLPRVNHESFSKVLEAFARSNGVDREHPAILVLDQARWHTTPKLEIPEGLSLKFLPPYSPELQPAERLWPLLDEAIINEYFEELEVLEEVIAKRCCQLSEQTEIVRGFTQFHWWPT